jgi:hypothetical protein
MFKINIKKNSIIFFNLSINKFDKYFNNINKYVFNYLRIFNILILNYFLYY